MKIWVILAVALVVSAASAAEISFPANTSDFLKSEVNSALALLPSNYFQNVRGPIRIREANYQADVNMSDNLCEQGEGSIYGFTQKDLFGRGFHLSFSARLLNLARTNTTNFACSHKTFREFLKATIIHELTHVKDFSERISSRPDFQRLVGIKKVQRNPRRAVMNSNRSASPDAYEFKNLQESLAVNTEYLVLDPEFECRKPATAAFLSAQLGIPLKNECTKNYKIITQSSYMEDNYLHEAKLDPKRVYRIDYLFAGKGKAIMSNWGHAMFRVVVCAPFRRTVGPECLNDVSHHLVLSYRAFMTDMNLSYLKGLNGDYSSQMFIFRFHEVQQEYTKFDLRDLISVPLNLTNAQKTEFLDVSLERYWTYQGKYFFVDNNCGSEAQKHLAIVLNDEQSRLVNSLTPEQMYKDLIRTRNNLTTAPLEGMSRENMIAQGYLIPGLFAELNSAFLYLKNLGFYAEKDFEEFVTKSRGADRLAKYQQYFARNDLSSLVKKAVLMKVVYMERYVTGKMLSELPKKAAQLMNQDEELRAAVMEMGGSLKSLTLQPWQVINSAYGVPLAHELESQYPAFAQKREEDLKNSTQEQIGSLETLMNKSYFTRELEEMDSAKEIKNYTVRILLETSRIETP